MGTSGWAIAERTALAMVASAFRAAIRTVRGEVIALTTGHTENTEKGSLGELGALGGCRYGS